MNIYEELEWRGLISQFSHAEEFTRKYGSPFVGRFNEAMGWENKGGDKVQPPSRAQKR